MKAKANKLPIPVQVREEALRVIDQFNQQELTGTGSRYIPRFKGKFLYLDRDDSGDVGHICRLEYAGGKRGWYFAIYKYSDERYDAEVRRRPGEASAVGLRPSEGGGRRRQRERVRTMMIGQFVSISPNQCAAANRRPAGQTDGSGKLERDGCRRSASPAAVAELAR